MLKTLLSFTCVLALIIVPNSSATAATAEAISIQQAVEMAESFDGHVGSIYKDVLTGTTEFRAASSVNSSMSSLSQSSDEYGMSPGYTPPSLLEPSVGGIGGIQPFVVIGTDDRISIPSPDESGEYRNTVYISTTLNGITYGASGFMIGPNAVATSGHVVYNATHGWITSATVTPARRSSNPISPYGTATAIAYECGYNYANGGSADDDWGIIYLDSNIGYSVGWLGLRWQSASYNDSSVSLIGYPGQVNGTDTETMHKSVGTIAESSNRTLRSADLDTSTGNSGGPWYRYYDSTGYTAISIHRGWILNNNTYYNDSTRIDQWLYDKLVSCRTSTL